MQALHALVLEVRVWHVHRCCAWGSRSQLSAWTCLIDSCKQLYSILHPRWVYAGKDRCVEGKISSKLRKRWCWN